jgi:hypothetical protein
LSPRARRLVESGLIDLSAIVGSGEGGKLTSGDILHAARIMEVEQSVARIEATQPSNNGDHAPDSATPTGGEEPQSDIIESVPLDDQLEETEPPTVDELPDDYIESELPDDDIESELPDDDIESTTFSAVDVGGDPMSVEPSPWEDYNGSTEGFSELAREGANQSWGEAEAHLAEMAEAAAGTAGEPPLPEPRISASDSSEYVAPPAIPETPSAVVPSAADSDPEQPAEAAAESVAVPESATVPGGEEEQAPASDGAAAPTEVMMDFGTLELVDPESVWAQGAEDFAPWFLAHSQQLGDVLGLQTGLSDARQFTTKSATGVLGRDDSGDDVVVVSSKNPVADDSDLGRALGMAASSGAASVALVSASLRDDQLKALSWLNSQTKSGVKWYGIEMKVVRIADSPAAMLFELVASPPFSER